MGKGKEKDRGKWIFPPHIHPAAPKKPSRQQHDTPLLPGFPSGLLSYNVLPTNPQHQPADWRQFATLLTGGGKAGEVGPGRHSSTSCACLLCMDVVVVVMVMGCSEACPLGLWDWMRWVDGARGRPWSAITLSVSVCWEKGGDHYFLPGMQPLAGTGLFAWLASSPKAWNGWMDEWQRLA